EPMGVVEAVGSAVTQLAPGDRVVVPFNISCGHCWMCTHGLQSQCETTQVHEHGTGAALLGYTKLYGQVAGGQAELLRVPQARYGIETFDVIDHPHLGDALRDRTGGRGPDSVIDAVGMEAHGSGGARAAQRFVGLLPDAVAATLMERAGLDRLAALLSAIDIV